MGLSVITLTRALDTPSLQVCKDSVSKALFSDTKHVIVPCPDLSEFNKTRYISSTMDEYTAIVDDDDTIPEDALKLCYAAMKLHNLDLVFTDEMQLDTRSGITRPSRIGRRRFEDINESAQAIHHLVMMKSSMVDKRCIEIAEKYSIGIDWLMHASVALRGNVMHIPKFGYTWSRHSGQHSLKTRHTYNHHFENIRNSIVQSWGKRSGLIPTADISELQTYIRYNNW